VNNSADLANAVYEKSPQKLQLL